MTSRFESKLEPGDKVKLALAHESKRVQRELIASGVLGPTIDLSQMENVNDIFIVDSVGKDTALVHSSVNPAISTTLKLSKLIKQENDT